MSATQVDRFEAARQEMLEAFRAALPHLGALAAAMEVDGTASCMRQIAELMDGALRS